MEGLGSNHEHEFAFDVERFLEAHEYAEKNLSDAMVEYFLGYISDELIKEHPDEAVIVFERLASHQDPEIRRTVAVCIGSLVSLPGDRGLELWKQLLSDNDARVRDEAVDSLDAFVERSDDQSNLSIEEIVDLVIVAKAGAQRAEDL